MKLKLILLFIIIGMVSASDSCTRPYNRIGELCCPDYDNDFVCDIATTTTMPDILIINSTHILDSRTNKISEIDPKKIETVVNSSQENTPPITIKPPKIKITTTLPTTTSIAQTSTTINIKTGSKQTTSTIQKYTTTTQKEYKSANRVTPMPTQENFIETNKFYIAGGVIFIIVILILFLYFIGDESDE